MCILKKRFEKKIRTKKHKNVSVSKLYMRYVCIHIHKNKWPVVTLAPRTLKYTTQLPRMPLSHICGQWNASVVHIILPIWIVYACQVVNYVHSASLQQRLLDFSLIVNTYTHVTLTDDCWCRESNNNKNDHGTVYLSSSLRQAYTIYRAHSTASYTDSMHIVWYVLYMNRGHGQLYNTTINVLCY